MGVGLRCFIAGAHLALGPQYRRFIVWPALLSLLIVVAGIVLTFGYIGSFSAYLRDLGIWPGIIDWLIQPLIYLFGILINVYLFSFLAVIIGAPWYSVLNERVDPPPSQRTTRWYKEIFPSLQRELIKLRYTLPRLLCLLLLGFIPFVNLIAPLLWLGYGGWLMAVQFCDFSFENRGRPFNETVDRLRIHRTTCMGFGALVTLGMSIPLFNFIIAPIAVAGAALLVKSLPIDANP